MLENNQQYQKLVGKYSPIYFRYNIQNCYLLPTAEWNDWKEEYIPNGDASEEFSKLLHLPTSLFCKEELYF